MIVKVTVYEQITECFDCEVEIPDGLDPVAFYSAISEAAEHERVNGDYERRFLTVDETWWEDELPPNHDAHVAAWVYHELMKRYKEVMK